MPIRVLLADDDPSVLLTLGRSLGLAGDMQIVGEAADGLEAVALVGRVPTDVIVMDHRMPVMSGLEATRRIRTAGIKTPVLIFTADETVQRRLGGLGAVAFLSKAGAGILDIRQAIRCLAGGAVMSDGAIGGPGG